MVKFLQALKVTLFYFVPLTISMGAMLLSVFLLNIHEAEGQIHFGTDIVPWYVSLSIFVGAAIIFVLFLFKGIGDITEAALIE